MKRIGVFGLGKSGISSIKLIKKCFPNTQVIAVNGGDIESFYPSISSYIPKGDCYSDNSSEAIVALSSCERIILSPGIPRTHKVLAQALNKNVSIINEVEMAFEIIKGRKPDAYFVGVTGTNGKTTTVSLIDGILKANGYKSFLGGNFGVPLSEAVLSETNFDAYIIELSSFQLESLESYKSNKAAILNITMSHGERYDDITPYAQAKFNISNNMTNEDEVYFLKDGSLVEKWGESLNFSHGLNIKECEQAILSFGLDKSKFKVKGNHNILNLGFALKLIEDKRFNLDSSKTQSFLEDFNGVEHRLCFLKDIDGLSIYNDAKSTNWESTLTAVNSFEGERLTLILGGQRRGVGDSILPHIKSLKERVNHILLVGESAQDLASELTDQISFTLVNDINGIQGYIKENKCQGVLLYSPAFPSFDQFKNYIERGNEFISSFEVS